MNNKTEKPIKRKFCRNKFSDHIAEMSGMALLWMFMLVIPNNGISQNVLWTKSIPRDIETGINIIAFERTSDNYFYYIGSNLCCSSLDLDFTPDTFNLPALNDYPIVDNDVLVKMDSSGSVLWSCLLGNDSSYSRINSMKVLHNDDVLVTGIFSGIMNFDPNSTIPYSVDGNGIFISKYSAAGNLIWLKIIDRGGLNTDPLTGIYSTESDTLGNFYFFGQAFDTPNLPDSIDFDPGPGVAFETINGSYNRFILKFDSLGQYIFVDFYSGNPLDIYSSCVNKIGEIFTCRSFDSGNYDVDPGPGVQLLSNGNYLIAYNPVGQLLWIKNLSCSFTDVEIDHADNIILAGKANGLIDLDPGPSTFFVGGSSGSIYAVIMAKFSSSGNFLDGKELFNVTNVAFQSYFKIYRNQAHKIYLFGRNFSNVDLDPGSGYSPFIVPQLSSLGGQFLIKMDENFNYLWSTQVHSGDANAEMVETTDNSLFFLGNIKPFCFDFNPDPLGIAPCPPEGLYLSKWNIDSCSLLSLVVDSLFDPFCVDSFYLAVHAQNGTPPYQYQWNNNPLLVDSIIQGTTPGLYSVTVTDATGCQKNSSLHLNGLDNAIGFDLWTNISPSVNISVNSIPQVHLFAGNTDCDSTSGMLFFVPDSNLTYQSSTIPPNLIIGDTLIWNVNNLSSSGNYSISITLFFLPDTLLQNGDTLWNWAAINPLNNDWNPLNNVSNGFSIVNSSFDPNNLMRYPQGLCAPSYINANQEITYTVNFQNTGTAAAAHINITDTLSAYLDINSLHVISASHNYGLQILPNQVLNFYFPQINLPDSGSNFLGSMGYVTFAITPLSGLPHGTLIENKANIFFDFNWPVVTNNEMNTISLDPDIANIDGNIIQNGSELIAVQPNSTYQWIDCLNGNSIISGAINQNFFPPLNGVYAVEINHQGCLARSECFDYFATALGEANFFSGRIFPNPVKGMFMLNWNGSALEKVIITNVLGQAVKLIAGQQKSPMEISVTDLSSGLYFVDLQDKYGTRIQLPLMIE